jgi:hypothetical protein
MSDISIIKLMNGSTIVGKLSIDGDIIEIEHPIELITTQFQQEGVGVGEQVHLRPWVSIAEEDIFVVERYNIITMATLQENFVAGYEQIVEQVYINRVQFEPGVENNISEEEIEEMVDYADAILNKQIH